MVVGVDDSQDIIERSGPVRTCVVAPPPLALRMDVVRCNLGMPVRSGLHTMATSCLVSEQTSAGFQIFHARVTCTIYALIF